jgi:hypothetical protein
LIAGYVEKLKPEISFFNIWILNLRAHTDDLNGGSILKGGITGSKECTAP